MNSETLWACFTVWATTGRNARDARRALVCKTKALISMDKGL